MQFLDLAKGLFVNIGTSCDMKPKRLQEQLSLRGLDFGVKLNCRFEVLLAKQYNTLQVQGVRRYD